MKRLASLFFATLLAFAPVAHADLRASSGAFGPINATSGTVATAVTGVATMLAQSFAQVTTPADVTEDTLATITVPPGVIGANGQLRVWVMWSYTNNANNKVMRVRYSGASGTQYFVTTRTTQLVTYAQVWLGNVNATNSQAGGFIENSSGTAAVGARTTSAVDTTASSTIVITGQKASGGDTLTLEGFLVEVVH